MYGLTVISFFQGGRMAPWSTQTVNGRGRIPSYFPQHTVVYASSSFLCTHFQNLPWGLWFPSAARPGPLNSVNCECHFSPPVSEPFCLLAGPIFSPRTEKGMLKGRAPCLCTQKETEAQDWLAQKPGSNVPIPRSNKRGLELQEREQAEKHCSVFLSSQLGLRTPNPL